MSNVLISFARQNIEMNVYFQSITVKEDFVLRLRSKTEVLISLLLSELDLNHFKVEMKCFCTTQFSRESARLTNEQSCVDMKGRKGKRENQCKKWTRSTISMPWKIRCTKCWVVVSITRKYFFLIYSINILNTKPTFSKVCSFTKYKG